MKVLRFASFFFLFNAAAPVAVVMSSDKGEDFLSSSDVDWIDLSHIDEDIVGSAGPPIDLVTQDDGVNSSVVDTQDDAQGSSVQRRLKTRKDGKASKKNGKKDQHSPTGSSPTGSSPTPPVISPGYPTFSPTDDVDLTCVDVFTGTRSYTPACADYVNDVRIGCTRTGQCVLQILRIEFDVDGNQVVDNDSCELLAKFSYAKVKATSSQCGLDLEPVQVSHFGKCSFIDEGLDYGGPNMLKAKIDPDGTMNLIFSADDGKTFFKDTSVAVPSTEVAAPGDNICINNVVEPAPLYEVYANSAIVSGSCNSDADCKRVNPDSWCSLEEGDDLPTPNYCYDCLNDEHCPGAEVCKSGSGNRRCETALVNSPSGISDIRRGYDIFKADPFFTSFSFGDSFSARDTGTLNIQRFFDFEWSDADDYAVDLGGDELVYEPIGFEVTKQLSGGVETTHKSFDKADSYVEEQSRALGIGGSGVVQGVDIGASAGMENRERVATDARTKTTTVTAKSVKTLYTFVKSSNYKLKLTEGAKLALENIKQNSLTWNEFFGTYGTHLTLGGIAGASQRSTFKFSESERSELKEQSSSFEQALSVGLPGVFTIDQTSSGSDSETIGNTIKTMNQESKIINKGDVTKIDSGEGAEIIERSLVLICEQVDQVEGVSKEDCEQALEGYCIEQIQRGNPSVTECNLPRDRYAFTCFSNDDCPGRQKCEGAFCVHECTSNSDCPIKFEECRSNECRPMPGERDNHGCQLKGGDEKWIGCGYGLECPSGYYYLRDESSVCWFFGSRIVCRKDPYLQPPCNRPLKGTCGEQPIPRAWGNGCCANGNVCNPLTGCAPHSVFKTQTRPTIQQCRDMGARS